MRLQRFLYYINIVIGVLAVGALAAVYWIAWRPVAQSSGTVSAVLAKPASATRDKRGIPHIRAASVEDAYFVQGYVTAQDRMWQMEFLRRLAKGQLSEILGPVAIESDREVRRLRMGRIAADAANTLPATERAQLAAYARGVNAYLEDHAGKLPLEFQLLRFRPAPWTPADSLAIAMQMFRTLTTSWKTELTRQALYNAGSPEKVRMLFPSGAGEEPQQGSNAWVLSGSRTTTGKPVLSNDPHLDYTIPGIWYIAHLQAPGLDVEGVTIPGAPAVIIGHNQRIAWGVTNLHYDVQDLYRERIDLRTGQYIDRGQPAQARAETERILVKGSQPVEFINWVTRHGPLLVVNGEDPMALRWTAAEPGAYQFVFSAINLARNWDEFRAALRRYPGPAQNFLYADVDGNIGYQGAALLPIRRGFAGDTPVDGPSGNFEWDGFIPFDDLPMAFNPPAGQMVTGNQNPFPASYKYPVNGYFSAPYRARQIRDLLNAKPKWRPDEMITVQRDVYSGFSHFLARQIAAAWDRRGATNPATAPAVALLRKWNGQMAADQAAPMVAALAYQYVRKAIAESAAPGKGQLYEEGIGSLVVEQILTARPPEFSASYDKLLLQALADAVEEGARQQGRDPGKWLYGKYHELTIAHPVGHSLPWVSSYFDIGPAPMHGSSNTVSQVTGRIGPSMRFTADLAGWAGTSLILPGGQSGHVLSRQYKNQWDTYYNGATEALPFAFPETGEVLRFEPYSR